MKKSINHQNINILRLNNNYNNYNNYDNYYDYNNYNNYNIIGKYIL